MGITLKTVKDWDETYSWLDKGLKLNLDRFLKVCGERGVKALEDATPKRTGTTSKSWRYVIERRAGKITIYWTNDNKTKDGDMIAVLLQYGHGTGGGGYVKGVDYINPAMKAVFDSISEDIGKAVMNL